MSSTFLFFLLLIGQLLIYNRSPAKPITIPEKNLEVQIIFPDKGKRLQPSPCLNINVLIINHTDTVASFFEDWNLWGDFNIYLQIRTNDTIYILYKKNRD